MLHKYYKFVLVNRSGGLITFNLAATGYGLINLKITPVMVSPSTGKRTYGSTINDDMQFDAGRTIAHGGEVMDDGSLCHSAEIDNSLGLYANLLVQIEVIHSLVGMHDTFDLYYASGDVSGQLETDAGYVSAETNKLRHIGSLQCISWGVPLQQMRSAALPVE